MSRYLLTFEGRESQAEYIDCADVDAARNIAVRRLGAYLAEHPDFAEDGHWRINVESEMGKPLLHVIVATVTARGSRDTPAGG